MPNSYIYELGEQTSLLGTDLLILGKPADNNGYRITGTNAKTYFQSGAVKTGAQDYNGTLIIGTSTSDSFKIQTGGADRVTILSGGSIGINYDTPQSKLHLYTGRINGNAVQEVLRLTGDWNNSYPSGTRGVLLRFTNYKTLANNPSTNEYNLAGITALDSGTSGAGDLLFSVAPAGTNDGNNLVEMMRLNHTSYTLGSTSYYLSSNFYGDLALNRTTNATLSLASSSETGSGSSFKLQAGSNRFKVLDGGASNAERLSLSSSGYLGINYSTPRTFLHAYVGTQSFNQLAEVARFQGFWNTGTTAADAGSFIRFTNYRSGGSNPSTDEYNVAAIAGVDFANGWGGGLQFFTAPTGTTGGTGLVRRMTIAANGYVGLGEESPDSLLHLKTSTDWALFTLENTSSGTLFMLNDYKTGRYNSSTTRQNASWQWGLAQDATASANSRFYIGRAGISSVDFAILEAGNLRLGTYTTDGDLYTSSSNGTVIVTSDKRLKTAEAAISSGLTALRNITPKNFEFINEPGAKKAGFIAQDVEVYIPEAVDGKRYEYQWVLNDDGTPKFDEAGNIVYALDENGEKIIRPRGFDTKAVLAYLWRAVQELDAQLQAHIGGA